MHFIIKPLALAISAISKGIFTLSVALILDVIAFVLVAVYQRQLALACPIIFYKVALVLVTVCA